MRFLGYSFRMQLIFVNSVTQKTQLKQFENEMNRINYQDFEKIKACVYLLLAENFMRAFIQAKEYRDGKLIRISTPFSSRTKLLDFFYAALFIIGAVGFVSLIATQWKDSIGATIIAILMIIACLVAFYRFINKATESEKLFVNQERLDIISSSLLKVDRKSFLVNEIHDFKFLEKERYEPHPLKGETFDYLGFQTEQQIIQDLHSEGRASFIYRGRQVRFGKELASWDFSELEVLLYEITGNDFRYTDQYEQQNFPRN